MKKKSFIRMVSCAAALALLLTACGNDGDTGEEAPEEVSTSIPAEGEEKVDDKENKDKKDEGEKDSSAQEEYVAKKDQVEADPYTITIRSGKREEGAQGDVVIIYNPEQEDRVMTSFDDGEKHPELVPELIANEDGEYQLTLADDFKGTISLGAGLQDLRVIGAITLDFDRGETEDFTIMFDGQILGDIKCKAKNLVVSTAGENDLTFVGSADKLSIEDYGKNKINMEDFKVKESEVNSSGESAITLNVDKKLDVHADDKASVQYKGEAKVEKDLSGDAKVEPMK